MQLLGDEHLESKKLPFVFSTAETEASEFDR
jgi:hypothetical protein